MCVSNHHVQCKLNDTMSYVNYISINLVKKRVSINCTPQSSIPDL